MSKMQRTKGRVFERFVATRIRRKFPGALVRRALQSEAAHESDVVVEGDGAPAALRQLWLECNDARNPDPRAKLAQAERDASRAIDKRGVLRLPVVVWHRIRERRIQATMRTQTLLSLLGATPPLIAVPTAGPLATLDLDELLEVLA